MKPTHQARLRNVAAALAVVLLHLVAIRALLGVRALFDRFVQSDQQSAMTWIILPPESTGSNLPKPAPDRHTASLSLAPLAEKNLNPGLLSQPVMTPLKLIPPVLSLPSISLTNSDDRVFAALGEYFACNFPDYDKTTEAKRERCGLQLSHLGDVNAFAGTYFDSKVTPFKLFGANGTFAFTPPAQRAYDLVQASVGCAWNHGLCQFWQPAKFGLDPDDQTRGTAAAHFVLAQGLTLDAGAQSYMQNYLGGGRLVLTGGVVLTYRW